VIVARPRGDGGMVRDGVWLSLGAAFTSVAGLLGWLISARLASRDVVGMTTTFTSGFLLVASLSQFSLGPAVLRWIPRAGGKGATLLARIYLIIIGAALLGVGVFLALPVGRGTLARLPGWGLPLFVLTTLAWAVMQFQDPVLTSLGRAGVVLGKNLGFGIGRVGILLLASTGAGALGIVLSWVIPAATAAIVVSVLVARAAKRRRELPDGRLPGRAELTHLLGPTYLATIGQSLLYYLLPLIVTGRVGAADGAVFFVVWTAVTALDVAGTAFVNSLVVRVAAQPHRAGELARTAGIRLAVLFGSAMVLGAAVAFPVLSLFGHDYAAVGGTALRLVLLGCVPRLLVLLTIGVSQAQGHGLVVAGLQLASAASMIPIAAFLPASLTTIATGFALVQLVVATAAGFILRNRLRAGDLDAPEAPVRTELAA
jgi:O-antigen/teichoic acid export membrane protein